MNNKDLSFLKIILCLVCAFQMGLAPALYANSQTTSPMHDNRQPSRSDCKKNQRWDSQRNSCVTTQDSVETREKTRKCSSLENDEERKNCHMRLAENDSGVNKGEGDDNNTALDMTIPALGLAFSGTMMIASKKMKSNCLSVKLMAGTSAAGLASEFFYKKKVKEELERLQKSYKQEVASDQGYNAQKSAFEYLREEQKLISELESKRRNTLYVLAAGYSLATGAAIISDSTQTNCVNSEGEAKPQEELPEGEELGAGAKFVNFIKDDLTSPAGVAWSSGVAATAATALAIDAGNRSGDAKKNVAILNKMIEKFEADFGQFCPQGHDDISDPSCYCNNLDGTKNTKRTNSETCQQYWASQEKNLFANAADYSAQGGPQQRPEGCAFFNGSFDPDCKCRQAKNSEGENACLRTGIRSSAAMNLGQAMPVPPIVGNLNRLSSGATGTGDFNPGQLSGLASASADRARSLLAKDFAKKTGKKLPSNEQILASAFKKIPPKALEKVAESYSTPSSGLTMSRPNDEAFQKALSEAKLEEDTPLESTLAYKKGNDLKSSTQKEKDDSYDYYDDWGEAQGGGNSGRELTFMDENYKYQQNDIVDKKEVSLWEIISKRYTQTGLRRLFPDENSFEDLN